jgi:hypothetical protein
VNENSSSNKRQGDFSPPEEDEEDGDDSLQAMEDRAYYQGKAEILEAFSAALADELVSLEELLGNLPESHVGARARLSLKNADAYTYMVGRDQEIHMADSALRVMYKSITGYPSRWAENLHLGDVLSNYVDPALASLLRANTALSVENKGLKRELDELKKELQKDTSSGKSSK